MAVNMDKNLRVWVDTCAPHLQIFGVPLASAAKIQLAVLHEFERQGYARRRLDLRGRVIWQATANMLDYLRDVELDAIDDFEDR